MRRFLNRILGLPVADQNLLFAYFSAALSAEIKQARSEGKYTEGLSDLAGRSVKLLSTHTFWTDPGSGLVTNANVFSVDRGVSFADALRRLEHEVGGCPKRSCFCVD